MLANNPVNSKNFIKNEFNLKNSYNSRTVTSTKKDESSFSYLSSFSKWVESFFYKKREEKSIFDIYFEEAPRQDLYFDQSKSFVENVEAHLKQTKLERDFIKRICLSFDIEDTYSFNETNNSELHRLDNILKAIELLESDTDDILFNKEVKEEYLKTLVMLINNDSIVLNSGKYFFIQSLKHTCQDDNKIWYNENIANKKPLKSAFDRFIEAFLNDSEENRDTILQQCGLNEQQNKHVKHILAQYGETIDSRHLIKYVLLDAKEIAQWEEPSILKRVCNAVLNNKGKIIAGILLNMSQLALAQNASKKNGTGGNNPQTPDNSNREVVLTNTVQEPKVLNLNLQTTLISNRDVKVQDEANPHQVKFESALKAKDWWKVARMLKNGAKEDPNNPVLHHAIEADASEFVIDKIIKAHPNFNPDSDPKLFELAIKHRNWCTVAVLLKNGVKEDPMKPVLEQAIEAGAYDFQIENIIKAYPNFNPDSGPKLFELAIKHQNWNTVAALLKNGVKEDPEKPVLEQAMEAKAYEIEIDKIIKAHPNFKPDSGPNLLELAIKHQNWGAAAVLLKNGVKEDPKKPVLEQAIEAGAYDFQIENIIKAYPNFNPDSGSNLLELAIKHRNWDAAEALLENGVKEDREKPILEQAIEGGASEFVIDKIIKAHPNFNPDSGPKLFELAIKHQNWGAAAVLLKNGVKEDPKKPVLEQAIGAKAHETEIDKIIKAHPHFNADSGAKLLELAIKHQNWGAAAVLLKNGVKEDPKKPVLEQAIEAGAYDFHIDKIIKAHPHFNPDSGAKLLELAIKHQNWGAAAVLLKKGVKENPKNPVLEEAIGAKAHETEIDKIIKAHPHFNADSGAKLLELAIERKNWGAAAVLIKNGVKEDPEKPVLEQAIEAGAYDFHIDKIIKAHPHFNPDSGPKLFELAIKHQNWGAAAVLIKNGVKEDPEKPILHHAIEAGAYSIRIDDIIKAYGISWDKGVNAIDYFIKNDPTSSLLISLLDSGAKPSSNQIKQLLSRKIISYKLIEVIKKNGAKLNEEDLHDLILNFIVPNHAWQRLRALLEENAINKLYHENTPEFYKNLARKTNFTVHTGGTSEINTKDKKYATIIVPTYGGVSQITLKGAGTLKITSNASSWDSLPDMDVTGADKTTEIVISSKADIVSQEEDKRLYRVLDTEGMLHFGSLSIASTDGSIKSIQAESASFSKIEAPDVSVIDKVVIADLHEGANDPKILFRKNTKLYIAGGSLYQKNGKPIHVSGLDFVEPISGKDAAGYFVSQDVIEGILTQDGKEVNRELVYHRKDRNCLPLELYVEPSSFFTQTRLELIEKARISLERLCLRSPYSIKSKYKVSLYAGSCWSDGAAAYNSLFNYVTYCTNTMSNYGSKEFYKTTVHEILHAFDFNWLALPWAPFDSKNTGKVPLLEGHGTQNLHHPSNKITTNKYWNGTHWVRSDYEANLLMSYGTTRTGLTPLDWNILQSIWSERGEWKRIDVNLLLNIVILTCWTFLAASMLRVILAYIKPLYERKIKIYYRQEASQM